MADGFDRFIVPRFSVALRRRRFQVIHRRVARASIPNYNRLPNSKNFPYKKMDDGGNFS